MLDVDRRACVTGAAPTAGVATTPAAAAYPKPPCPVQRQPWPGLASKMTPRPDDGETR